MLRKIRATLAEHSVASMRCSKLLEHSHVVAELRDELQQIDQNCVYAPGFSTLNQRDSEATREHVSALATRVLR